MGELGTVDLGLDGVSLDRALVVSPGLAGPRVRTCWPCGFGPARCEPDSCRLLWAGRADGHRQRPSCSIPCTALLSTALARCIPSRYPVDIRCRAFLRNLQQPHCSQSARSHGQPRNGRSTCCILYTPPSPTRPTPGPSSAPACHPSCEASML